MKTKKFINARINEGYKETDFYKVIDVKCSKWLNDPKMNEYLRPETLFGTKFESYLNEKPLLENKKVFIPDPVYTPEEIKRRFGVEITQ